MENNNINNLIGAVALSIMALPGSNKLWDYIETGEAWKIYEKISAGKKLKSQKFITQLYSVDPLIAAKQIIEKCHLKKINIITYWDKSYPILLKQISHPPIVLYSKGEFSDTATAAIVGTRKADKRACSIARRIANDLALHGYTVVSGMAIGIDREAHIGALEMEGNTLGILANGIDIFYPKFNTSLYHRIVETKGSALLSEYPPGIFAGKWTFVRRNRIISGLSLGTVVVKAAEKSGALITANYALEQNREIFVCPGYSFDESYIGCNNLIKSGAMLVSDSLDIIKELNRSKNNFNLSEIDCNKNHNVYKNNSEKIMNNDLSPLESKILDFISTGEYDLDDIKRKMAEVPMNDISQSIMALELYGKIFRNGNVISASSHYTG
jgi:DNA processing protein